MQPAAHLRGAGEAAPPRLIYLAGVTAPLAASILVVDDDPAVRKVAVALLRQAGFAGTAVQSGAEALAALEQQLIDVVVTDLRMPEIDGMELLAKITAEHPDVPVVMMTAHGSIPIAVEAMKRGAADFLLKPFDREELLFVVRKAVTAARREERRPARAGEARSEAGASASMRDCEERMARAAQGMATVLLRGESGTGKSVAARAIHDKSPRSGGAFVTLQCAALPDSLFEAELFGHEKGAFTGAVARKPGRVELAQGGTLFLDEIGDISRSIQVKLLRLVQEREFERVGGLETLAADVRFIAATHRDLEAMVKEGAFREDLFYRLNVIPIHLPPLRERPEDFDPLCAALCATLGARNGRPGATLDAAALEALRAQAWPGNVRELQNLIERLIVMSSSERIDRRDVERELSRALPGAPTSTAPAPPRASEPSLSPGDPGRKLLAERRRETERETLVAVLRQAGQNRTVAARLLGVSRRTLYNKIDEHGLAGS